ncbi:hypothetical protein A7982_13312 [Minicystis rosea]|nr:hypothetical protein A7982_13312 [Minicystis rosea]
MGCWTGYALREASGEKRTGFEKWGRYELGSTLELDAVVAHVREIAGPVVWDGWLCCGLYIDLAAREVRFHGCALRLSPRELGAAMARVRDAIGGV